MANQFLTEEEIFLDFIQRIRNDPKMLDGWMKIPQRALIQLHHNVGQDIRNHYKLWDKDNPHTKFGNSFVDRNGVASHPNHADQMSMRVIRRVWDELHK